MIVREANDEQARQDIELTSESAGNGNIIRFVPDGAGKWFITYTVYNSSVFAFMRTLMEIGTHDLTYTPPVEEE
jgi:hypothetical protein